MTTKLASAYPIPVEDLVPRAREIVESTGSIPSQNELKRALRVGAGKAKQVREILLAGPTEPEPETGGPSAGIAELPSESAELQQVDDATEAQDLQAQTDERKRGKHVQFSVWPLLAIALPAFVATWSGWVGLGGLAGFGVVYPLPGIADEFSVNTAITLPIGVEVYGAYALRIWLGLPRTHRARPFAKWSALGSLAVGALGQIAYHVLVALGHAYAPWPIVVAVSTLPVAVLGAGAALAHLVKEAPDAH